MRIQFVTTLIILFIFIGCKENSTSKSSIEKDTNSAEGSTQAEPEKGTVELVAELPMNPGNVAVSSSGRVFASIHQFRNPELKLVEIKGKNEFVPYPDEALNGRGKKDSIFNAVLGIYADTKNRLWVLDNGMTDAPTQPKLMVFDLTTDALIYRYDFPKDVAAPGSFLQDLVVDPTNDVTFIADIGGSVAEPAIVFVDIKKSTSRRFTGHPSLMPEDYDLMVEGKTIMGPNGKPNRIGLNPIAISDGYEKIFFGAMNGKTWYSLPIDGFLTEKTDEAIAASITKAGTKPVSDGAATDAEGNHYFTDVNNNAITYYSSEDKQMHTLVMRKDFIWPDNVRFGPDNWLYVSVNQLNRAPAFNDGNETSEKPFKIFRVWTGTKGHF